MPVLLTRIKIFLTMIFTRDGNGFFIGILDALWYARHLEWWGIDKNVGRD